MKDQIVFKFPDKSFYYEEDFCVGENNYEAYKLIKEWPNWSFKGINIYGPKKSGKSYLTKIFSDKAKSKIFDSKNIKKNNLDLILSQNVLIIEDIDFFSDEVFFQTILNDFISKNKFIYLTSNKLSGSISFKYYFFTNCRPCELTWRIPEFLLENTACNNKLVLYS